MTALSAQTYGELVVAVRDLVDRYLPTRSTVAVVSRGDAAMLELGERVGVHVPSSEDGRYVGYHPADGPDAIRAVESVRARGADFLLVPDSSSWWLTHYDGLLEHLGPPLTEEPGTGILFALSGRPSLLDREGTERARIVEDLADIAGLLLPPGSAVMVVDDGASLDASLRDFQVTSVAPDTVSPEVLGTTSFLLVPCWHYDWLAGRDDIRDVLTRQGKLVTWQQHVGAIYELPSQRGEV